MTLQELPKPIKIKNVRPTELLSESTETMIYKNIRPTDLLSEPSETIKNYLANLVRDTLPRKKGGWYTLEK